VDITTAYNDIKIHFGHNNHNDNISCVASQQQSPTILLLMAPIAE
jgi:hypothetical protein